MKFLLKKQIISRVSLCLSVALLVVGSSNTYAATSYDGMQGNKKVASQGVREVKATANRADYGYNYTTTSSSLDIQAPNYVVNGGCEFETYVVINNARNIYAEDIQVHYDSAVFEYIGGDVTTSSALKIYNNPAPQNGVVRYIVASRGQANGLNGNAQILKLKFRAKNAYAIGTIQITKGEIADGYGNEFNVMGGMKTFTVTPRNADVNNDGKYTLGDLAIAGRLFSTTPEQWGYYRPDVDFNLAVDDVDLSCIVSFVLNSEK